MILVSSNILRLPKARRSQIVTANFSTNPTKNQKRKMRETLIIGGCVWPKRRKYNHATDPAGLLHKLSAARMAIFRGPNGVCHFVFPKWTFCVWLKPLTTRRHDLTNIKINSHPDFSVLPLAKFEFNVAPLGPAGYDSPRWQAGAYDRSHVPTGLFSTPTSSLPGGGEDDVVFCYKGVQFHAS